MKVKQKQLRIISILVILAMMVTSTLPGVSLSHVYAEGSSQPGKIKTLSLAVSCQPAAKLTWDQADGADAYKVYRNNKAIAEVYGDPGRDTVSYVDKSLDPAKSYHYTVKAVSIEDEKITYGPASPDVRMVDGYTYEENEDGITLTGYTGKDKSLSIPSSIDGRKVTVIGKSCFANNPYFEKIRIPEGVTRIEDFGFECCSIVKKVYFPESLESIGEGAFSGCARMTVADMQEGVTSIGRGAFLYCMKLQTLELPEELNELGRFAFAGCQSLTSVTFDGDKVTELPDRLFCNCYALRTVDLPDGITSIGKRAFSGCANLENLFSKESNTILVGDYAFEGCESLRTEFFDYNAMIYGYGVFTGGLKENSFLNIYPGTRLSRGSLYRSHIVGATFTNEYGYVMDDLANEDYQLINGSLYSIDGKTLIAYLPWEYADYDQKMTSDAEEKTFKLAEGVTEIWPFAFNNAELDTLYLPTSLKTIGDYVFYGGFVAGDKEALKDYDGNPASWIAVSESAFEPREIWEIPVIPSDEGDTDPENPGDTGESDGSGSDEEYDDTDPEGWEDWEWTTEYQVEPYQEEKSLYDPANYEDYVDVSEGFEEWARKYLAYNEEIFSKLSDSIPYILLYKGEEHYRQMTSALNHDQYKVQQSIERSGDDYEEMYLMMDHGLMTELKRGQMPDNLVLYSGITPERKACVVDPDQRTRIDITMDELAGRVGSVYMDEAIMSTTGSPSTAFGFSGGEYGSHTIFVIYASRQAMEDLGAVTADAFENQFGGESEVLFNANARYKVLETGTYYARDYANGELQDTSQRTYIRMELLADDHDKYEDLDGSEDLYEPVYEWADDYSSVMASVAVNEDGTIVETETSTHISYEVTKKPTSTETGTGKYTVTFQSGYFSDQTKEITIPALTDEEVKARDEAFDGMQNLIVSANATLADGQGKYTKESLSVLQKAVNAANQLYQDTSDTLTEADVNLAADAVMKALRSLTVIEKDTASAKGQEDKATDTESTGGKTSAPAFNINISYSKIKNRTYTGKAVKPGVTVKIGSTVLKKGRDYTLSYKNNKNVGTATVVITGKGDYKGTVKKTFKILPKGTSLTRLNPKKKGLSIRWKKNTKQTTGYQIQYSLKKNFSGAKSKNIGNKVTSLSLRKLKGRKRYYVRIRTYKKIKGKKYYSAWSKSKTVVTRR